MRVASHWGQAAYAATIRLYPRGFRAEFGEEMQAVFAEAMAEAGGAGAIGIAALWLRELRDLPVSLLRAHRHAHSTRCPPQARPAPARPASFARWGALGFGIGFALIESMPDILGPALQPYRSLAPLIGLIPYLAAGGLSGALLGMASRSRRTIFSFTLAGSLAFALSRSLTLALAVWVTDSMVTLSSLSAGVLATLPIIRPILIGALVGGLAGAAQRRWNHAARWAFIGALVFGLGRIAGVVLELPPWAAAQAVASYQAAPANAWIADVPFYLMVFAGAVSGVVGGAYLGLNLGRRQAVANR